MESWDQLWAKWFLGLPKNPTQGKQNASEVQIAKVVLV